MALMHWKILEVILVAISALTWYFYYWNLQCLNNVIIFKTKVLFPHAYVTLTDFDYPQSGLGPLVLLLPLLNYLTFQYFDIKHTWWRLFQKCVVCTKSIVGNPRVITLRSSLHHRTNFLAFMHNSWAYFIGFLTIIFSYLNQSESTCYHLFGLM